MWLHVPSAFCPSAPVSAVTTLDSEQCSLLERFATSSGKRSPRRSWSLSWRRNVWMQRLSGLTLPPSTLARGAASWIASLQGSPASPTASLVSDEGTTTSAHVAPTNQGLSCTPHASSPSVSPPWCSSRTSQIGFEIADSGFDPSAKNYADWVTRSKIRSSSLRRMLAHRIDASASGSWPTSRAEDSESCGNHPGSGGDALNAVAASWPTPRGMDAHGAGYMNQRDGSKRLMLAGATEQWPTPDAGIATSNRSPSPNASTRPAIAKAAELWTTPQAHDEAGGNPDRVRRCGTKHGAANLADDVTSWATPTARMMRGGAAA